MDYKKEELLMGERGGFRERLLMGGPRTVTFCVVLLLFPWLVLGVVSFWLEHFAGGPWTHLPFAPFIAFAALSLVNLSITIGVLEGCHGLTRRRCQCYKAMVYGAGLLPPLGFTLYLLHAA